MEYKDNLLACRFEKKYLLQPSQAHAIENYIKCVLPLDSFSQNREDGYYPISSLYLDSDSFQLFQESMSGKKNRFKLRIRTYDEGPVFVEIKRRINQIIFKSRTRIPAHEVGDLLKSTGLNRPSLNHQEALNQFKFYQMAINAKPKVLIRYLRKAYEGGQENRTRVTLDRGLEFQITDAMELRCGERGMQKIQFPWVILEIKFTGYYPLWMDKMVKTFNLNSQSVSKYTASIRQACMSGSSAPVLAPACSPVFTSSRFKSLRGGIHGHHSYA